MAVAGCGSEAPSSTAATAQVDQQAEQTRIAREQQAEERRQRAERILERERAPTARGCSQAARRSTREA
jgi:hypothetical protein